MLRFSDVIAYWLLPAMGSARDFAATIGELAAKFGGPIFDPHLTIYAGGDNDRIARDTIAEVSATAPPISLTAVSVEHSERFTKTLYLQFAPKRELLDLSDLLHERSAATQTYELNPHLSLLYADLAAAIRAQEAEHIVLPSAAICFDRLRAVRFTTPIRSRADVESWQAIGEGGLTG